MIDQINDINTNDKLNEEYSDNWHLFSIDVKSLYPSISPDLAITALQDASDKCTGMDENLKFSITKMVTFCLSNSFIVYQNNSYKTLKGIPTGGSISRQEADIFLHWLIFIVLSGKIPMWNLIKFWRRYIDDILGIWRGTERQFKQFISNLNSLTLPYGIKFDKTKIGKSINFLDTTLYLEKDDSGKWKIQHSLYRKPTDAVRFLRRDSFHPPHIFKSVPYSQYLRVISRHSKESTRDESMRELTRGFMEAGYKENELDTQRNKALNSSIASEDPNTTNIQPDTLVFA